MQIGMIGLGRMGLNMSRRLLRGRHAVVGLDPRPEAARELTRARGRGVTSDGELVRLLKPPRVVWLMIPAGAPVDAQLGSLRGLLSSGDLVVDGGNSDFRDAIRRERELGRSGIGFMDVGVSGGVWGLAEGYCLMAGGAPRDFKRLEPALKTLAPKSGYLHCGPVGAGHFTKMVHNGIEYGLMQAYAEGFELLQSSEFKPDLAKISDLWNRGSVVRSWLLELAARAFSEDPGLRRIRGYVEDSGEGRWTVREAVQAGVATPAITLALYQRFLSRKKDAFSNRVLAALRHQFGGHAVRPARR